MADHNLGQCRHGILYLRGCSICEEAAELKKPKAADLLDYVKHDSWRCSRYKECHCGLDKLTDALGLARVHVDA